MNTKFYLIIPVIAVAFFFLIDTVDEADARGLGGARADKKLGGGSFSRHGAAASGSFSSGSRRGETRQGRQQASGENVEPRQEGRTDRTEYRQEGHTDRTKARQLTAQSQSHHGHGNHYDNDDWDDGEVAAIAIGAAALGAMGGYVAGESSASQSTSATPPTTVVYSAPPPSGSAGLPCTPYTAVVNGVTYYQCGATWYTQAYGSSGVIYMPVPAPH